MPEALVSIALYSRFVAHKRSKMKSVWTLLLLGLLTLAIVAPFSALAMLMLFTLVSVVIWTGWTLIRTLFTGDVT